VRALLTAVDMEGEALHTRTLERLQFLHGEKLSVSVDDGFLTIQRNHLDDLFDLRVSQWITTGDGDSVGLPESLEDVEFLPYLL